MPYAVEPFIAWYTGDPVERGMVAYRALGSYWPYFWVMTFCNAILPLAYFWRRVRRSFAWLLGISLLINVGMWLERYVIIVTPLAHDFMPHTWTTYRPTWVEVSISLGAGCFFLLAFLIAVKLFPAVAIAESKPRPAPPEVAR